MAGKYKMDAFNRAQDKKKYNQRFVDYYNNKDDHDCALLGAFGFTTKFIAKKVPNLSEGQVGYRIRNAGICRADIRNGNSPFAQLLFKSARDVMEAKLMAHLRNNL